MPKRNVEKLIPVAMKVFAKHKNKLKPETKGYFASFGPSVMMAGLLQTVLFYDSKSEYINTIIWEIMTDESIQWSGGKKSLKDLVENDNNILNKKRVLEVIVACKLVIKTYKLEE